MTDERDIRCVCGKLLAVERDGKLYLKCRGCRHEHEITIENTKEYRNKS